MGLIGMPHGLKTRLRAARVGLRRTAFAAALMLVQAAATPVGRRKQPLLLWSADAATFLAGVGLVSYGAWLAYPPAGFIVGGALLIVFTVK